MIVTVTLNPSVDHALFLPAVVLNDVNRVQKVERDAGGKGVNLSRMAARLGADTLATGFLGGGAGSYVRSVLDAHQVRHLFVPIAGETRVNFSVEDSRGLPPTTFNEPGPEIQPDEVEELFLVLESLLNRAQWLALGGSLPPGLDASVVARLVAFGRARGVRVSLDADGQALKLGLSAKPHFIKPNTHEAERLLGRRIESLEDAIRAADEIRGLMGPEPGDLPALVLSRGPDPTVMACGKGIFVGRPAVLETRSTIGCGDSMVAGFLWALDEGRDIAEAFRWGMAAGAATAASGGSDVGTLEDVRRFYEQVSVECVGLSGADQSATSTRSAAHDGR